MGENGQAAEKVAATGLGDLLNDSVLWDQVIKDAVAKAQPPSAWTPLVEGSAQAKRNQAPTSYLTLLSMDGDRKSALLLHVHNAGTVLLS